MSTGVFDRATAIFGWDSPFDLYDPALPVSVVIPGSSGSQLMISAGCKLSTLLHALQLRGMEKPCE